MVPAHSHRVSRVPWYSGSCRVPFVFAYGAFTLSGRSFQDRLANNRESLMQSEPRHARMAVWALSISLAATLEIEKFSFFSSGYLDVSVHRVPPVQLWIHCTVHEGCSCGFPHSDTCGSLDMCSSPQLFAAYRVFHRLSVPRHPPCALLCLTWFGTACIALHAQAWFVFCCPCSRTLSFTAVWLCSRHASCFHSASGYLGCLIRIN